MADLVWKGTIEITIAKVSGGIGPVKLLCVMLRLVRFGNEKKRRLASVSS